MVAYFCHYLLVLYRTSRHHYLTSRHHNLTSRKNDLTSRHYYKKVVFSNNFVDLSDNYVDLSDLYVDLSDIMSNCQIILLLSGWHLLGKNTFLRFIFLQINKQQVNKKILEDVNKLIECIAKRCLISQYVTTALSKAVKQDDRSLV